MAESTEKDMKRLSSPRFGITSNVVMWQLQVASGLESLKIFSSALANGKQQEMHSLKKISFRRTQMMCPYTLKIGSIMRLSIFCSGRRTTCLPKKGKKDGSSQRIQQKNSHLRKSKSWRHLLPGFCLLYTSDAADDLLCVDLGGRRIIKKK